MSNGEMLNRMLVLATNAHAGQFDKGGKPYILHPLKVMHMLRSDDEELNCIALGHDLIEDTKIAISELHTNFSDRIVKGIANLTKFKGESYEKYIDNILRNRDAIQVKMCDLRHNSDLRRLRGVTQKDLERVGRYCAFYKVLEEALK
jgi:(p)ppGpp synthase/HD superfamily hydrolase